MKITFVAMRLGPSNKLVAERNDEWIRRYEGNKLDYSDKHLSSVLVLPQRLTPPAARIASPAECFHLIIPEYVMTAAQQNKLTLRRSRRGNQRLGVELGRDCL